MQELQQILKSEYKLYISYLKLWINDFFAIFTNAIKINLNKNLMKQNNQQY